MIKRKVIKHKRLVHLLQPTPLQSFLLCIYCSDQGGYSCFKLSYGGVADGQLFNQFLVLLPQHVLHGF